MPRSDDASTAERIREGVAASRRKGMWMRESGEFATIAGVAKRLGIASSYMTRVLRLILLAPGLVDAMLGGTQGPELTLARVQEPFPQGWAGQRD